LLDESRLQLACVYLSPSLGEVLDPRLPESIKRMKGRPTRIELAIQSKRFRPSDPAGDEAGVDLVKRVSDMAGDLGPVVSIYPHAGAWTERVQDGVRLSRLADRKNVGTNFNLVHWSWLKQDEPLEKVLRQALPYLKTVSINGLDGRKIVPLDQGGYDVTAVMRTLQHTGYKGPVGFQGYGIPGPSRTLLERSMHKWREIQSALSV
jgi:sugar phosphate isomerase/epimerase